MAGERSRRLRRVYTGEAVALVEDNNALFEAEINPTDRVVDLDSKSEDEFAPEGTLLTVLAQALVRYK